MAVLAAAKVVMAAAGLPVQEHRVKALLVEQAIVQQVVVQLVAVAAVQVQ
jgi:hypothetical protein